MWKELKNRIFRGKENMSEVPYDPNKVFVYPCVGIGEQLAGHVIMFSTMPPWLNCPVEPDKLTGADRTWWHRGHRLGWFETEEDFRAKFGDNRIIGQGSGTFCPDCLKEHLKGKSDQ